MHLGILVSQTRQDQEPETWRRAMNSPCAKKRPQSLVALWRAMSVGLRRGIRGSIGLVGNDAGHRLQGPL